MRIETKFDVGRTAWVIDSNATFAKCPKCRQHLKETGRKWFVYCARKVTHIGISVWNDVRIRYGLNWAADNCRGWEDESDLFFTKAQAQAVCDSRNKKKAAS